jgi:hypothetical protein
VEQATVDDVDDRYDLRDHIDYAPAAAHSRPRFVRGTGVLAVIVIGLIAAVLTQQSSQSTHSQLPVTAQRWASAYRRAARSPRPAACKRLFASTTAARAGCAPSFRRAAARLSRARITGTQDVADLQASGITIILQRFDNGGWQATDVVVSHRLL